MDNTLTVLITYRERRHYQNIFIYVNKDVLTHVSMVLFANILHLFTLCRVRKTGFQVKNLKC